MRCAPLLASPAGVRYRAPGSSQDKEQKNANVGQRRRFPEEETHETKNASCCAGRGDRAGRRIHGAGAGADHHAQRRGAVQRRPRLHQGAGAVRGAGEEILRQADQFRPAQELLARAREAVFRVYGAGQGGRLRHRLAGAYVDLLEGGAVHRCAVPVPRSRPLEQGARRRRAQARRRRDREKGRRHADRLCRRRRAQHLRQQAGGLAGRDQGPQGARAGRADLVEDLRGDRHVADGDRL